MQTNKYRQSIGISILYLVRSIILIALTLLGIITIQYFIGKEYGSTILVNYPRLLSNDFAAISSVIIGILYWWGATNISVKISDDELIVKRFFIKRCQVDLWTTRVKVIQTTTHSISFNGFGNVFTNILTPKRIKIVVVNSDSSKTKINATGLGINNADALREHIQMYSGSNPDLTILHSTQVSSKPKNLVH
ncbi:MAG: hypothetical protein RR565_06280 [Erysipelothrix sp.]